jgi:hypothetical protein
MKTIIEYQCEICQRKYSSEDQALQCEARGVFTGENYPVGLMYNYEHNGFVGIFAVAPPTFERIRNHYATLVSWACRAPGYPGDSLGSEMCSGNNTIDNSPTSFRNWISYNHIPANRVNGPEFTRMVEFLKSYSITPRYYDHNLKLIEL